MNGDLHKLPTDNKEIITIHFMQHETMEAVYHKPYEATGKSIYSGKKLQVETFYKWKEGK